MTVTSERLLHIDKLPTGISGFDHIAAGGLPLSLIHI